MSGEVRWTPEQEQAITARGTDLLVAAAAGSGKTAVLVERVIRRLTDPGDPIDVDELLVVTFTEAAAAEMRERIGAAIEAALAKDPDNERLLRQLALLGRAAISTLHSFCLSLVRQYFYRLGIDPSVSVMGEHEALLLRHEVLDDLFARRFDEEEDGPFHALVDRYGGGRGDEGLRQLVLAVYDYMQSLPWPEAWLEESLARFDVPEGAALEDLPWWPPLRRKVRLDLERAADSLADAARLTRLPGGPVAYADVLAAEEAAVRRAARAETYDDLAAAVKGIAFGRLPRAGKDVDEKLKEKVQNLRDGAKKAVRGVLERYFGRTAAEWLGDLRVVAPHLRTLGQVVTEFAAEFRAAKAAQSAVDFNDLERFALQLLRDPASTPERLVPSDVARDLRARYKEVLVDEYQDINGVQDAILTLVSRDGEEGPPNRFMVGDVKQSIYRFRHADPSLFMAKYAAYRPWSGAPDPAASGARIVLGANFRSRLGVVDAVNFLFRQIMTPEAGEIAYDKEAELVYRAGYPPLPAVPGPSGDTGQPAEVPAAAPAPVPPEASADAPAGTSGETAAEPAGATGAASGAGASGDTPAGTPSGPAAHVPAGFPAEPPVELHLLDREEPAESEEAAEGATEGNTTDDGTGDGRNSNSLAEELADLTAMEREARLIARRIREMVDGTPGEPPLQVWDRKLQTYRRVRYRDIVVLLRATTGRANTFVEVLGQAGIPAYAQMATGYFSATEVEVILSLLQILDNPRQDIPLAAVLHSPIVGLSAADLARIRLADPRGSFYDALVAAARSAAGTRDADATAEGAGTGMAEAAAAAAPDVTPSQPDGLAEVLSRFLAALDCWRTLARRRPLSQVIWQILQETRYLHYVGGMPGGAQRQANLLALYERARQFDQFARQGLFRFLRFIERMRAESQDMGTAPALGEAEDVVRVMTIHKSKGLEFPVVFVAGLGRKLDERDLSGDLLLERGLGFGPMLVDPESRVKYPTIAHHAVREATRLASLAEELRVLYVALTRARERLVLVGSVAKLRAACQQWSRAAAVAGWPLPESLLLSARTYLDWIGPAVIRHAAGAPLRRLAGPALDAAAGLDAAVAGDPSRWQVTVWDPKAQEQLVDLAGVPGAREQLDWARIAAAEPLDRPLDPALGDALRARFAWRYPYEPVVRRFGKLSVTELKGHFDPDAEAPGERLVVGEEDGEPIGSGLSSRPRFLQEERKGLSPTERGTAAHLVLQHLDLTRPLDAAGVGAQLSELVAGKLLTPQQAAAVDAEAIAAFFASPLGRRIRERPDRVRREVSFTLAVPAAEVYPDLSAAVASSDVVIVQGMIDLLLEEDDGFVLVDYKTDRREPEQAALRYGTQIRLYRRAVEEILGRPVKEAYLHFLASHRSLLV